jgi:hypothetical protein
LEPIGKAEPFRSSGGKAAKETANAVKKHITYLAGLRLDLVSRFSGAMPVAILLSDLWCFYQLVSRR